MQKNPAKAAQSHLKATTKRVDRQPIATPMRPQSHPNASPRLPQSYPKATPKPGESPVGTIHNKRSKSEARSSESEPGAGVARETSRPMKPSEWRGERPEFSGRNPPRH